MNTKRLKCFVSYSHKDIKMFGEFSEHIKCLERIYDIDYWYDGKIVPGENIDDSIKSQLNSADIIFLLVSPSYISSYYCYEKELKDALQRHLEGKCKVVPVIIKKYTQGEYIFSDLKFVPTDGRAVTSFKSHNDGFVDAVTGITKLLEDVDSTSIKNQPTYGKSISKNDGKNSKSIVRYKIIRKERIANVILSKNIFDSIVSYGQSLSKFVNDMNTLSKESFEFFKKDSQKPISMRAARYSIDLEDYMIQMCGYIQCLFIGYDNTCIHIRKRKDDLYFDYIEVGYSKNDISTEPIAAEKGMIECSKRNNMPVVKSLNASLHKETHPNERIKRDYITFAFNSISKNYNVDLSMCISIVGLNPSNEILIAMSIMRFDLLIEKYIIQYIEYCKNTDARYRLT